MVGTEKVVHTTNKTKHSITIPPKYFTFETQLSSDKFKFDLEIALFNVDSGIVTDLNCQ